MPRRLGVVLLAFLGLASSALSAPPVFLPFQVSAMVPADGSTVVAPVTEVVVTCNANVDPTSVNTTSVKVTGAGLDDVFNTGDDVAITPASVTVQAGNQIKVAFSTPLAFDLYRVSLSGTVTEPTGLLHHWKLDEGSGTAAADSGPGALNGLLENGPTWSQGKIGGALHMNGGIEHVLLGAMDLPAPWSVSVWVRREDSPNADSRILSSEGASLRLEQYNHTNKVGFTKPGVADYVFGYTAPVGTWTQLTFLNNGSQILLFANAIFADQNNNLIPCPRGFIGSGGGNTLKGDIDEVRIYNKSLVLAEMQQLAALGYAVRSTTGQVLDGEFSGSLPSGNGADGGDFVATFTAAPAPPVAPSGLFATATGPSTINLSWSDNSADETGFKVERSANGVLFEQIATTAANTTTYGDFDLNSSTQYWYRVRAFNTFGNSAYSNVATATTNNIPATIKVASMSPLPGSTLPLPPGQITVTFTSAIDAATVNPQTVRLVRAGPDAGLGTPDDVVITPVSVTMLTPTQMVIDVSGLALPNDAYRLRLSGTPAAVTGLINHWKFDEGTGATAFDSVPGGANGTISGPTYTTGRINTGLTFNGGTHRVITSAVDVAAPWSAAMWVNRTDSPAADARLMDSQSYPNGGSLRLEQFNGTNKVGVTHYGASWDASFDYTAPIGAWAHLAFVCDGTQLLLYVNGALVDTIPGVIDLPRWHLGSHGSNAMRAILDDVRVYAKALTAAEAGAVASLGGAIRDPNGIVLDGEFSGSFPSGNGFAGGDFTGDFGINVPVPVAPSNLQATDISLSQIQLTWNDNSSNEAQFHIERSTDNATFTQVATRPANTTTYVDDDLQAGTKYWYRVRASVASQFSGYSNIADALTNEIDVEVTGPVSCGAIGFDGLLIPGILLLWRRLRRRC